MKTNWQTKKLGEVVGIQNGFAFKSSEYVDSGFFVMRITNVQDGYIELNNPHYIKETNKSFKNFVLKEGDILMSLTGNVGRIGVVKKEHLPAVLNQRVAKLFVKNQLLLDKDYLLNFLRSPKFFNEVVSGGKGMAQQNVSTKDIENLEIPLPPLETQKEIVAKLDEKFAKLRESEKLREEALADTEKILSQTLREIFEEGKQKGWEEVKIADIASVSPAKSEIKDYSDSTPISFVPMSSVDEYSQAIEVQQQKKLGDVRKGYTYFKRGDIILAKVTPCMENGKIAIADNLETQIGFGSSEFHVIRADQKSLYSKYLYQILRQKDFREIAEKKMTGTSGLKRVPKEFIENYKIPLPSFSEQQKIVAKLDKLSEKKTLRELQKSQLEDLKLLEKAYLREAFNGELDVNS